MNLPQSKKQANSKEWIPADYFANFLFKISLVFVLLLLFVSALTTTLHLNTNSESPVVRFLFSDGWRLPLAGIIGAILVLIFVLFLNGLVMRCSERRIVFFFFVVTTLFGLWWVLSQDACTSRFGDSYRLLKYAKSAANGDWTYFTNSASITEVSKIPDDAHLYFLEYPFQAGIFYYFYLFYLIFGNYAFQGLLVANVIANEITLAAVMRMTYLLENNKSNNSKQTVLLLALCVPLHLSAIFPYGNNVGLALGSIFLAMQCEAIFCKKSTRATFILGSIFPLFLALAIKSTFILLAIASLLAWIVYSLKNKDFEILFIFIVVFVLAKYFSNLPVRVLENKVGYSFGAGMPKSSWIVLGTSRSEISGAAGWWDSKAIDIFTKSNGLLDKQNAFSNCAIQNNFVTFVKDPKLFLNFYIEKMSTEWADPTFECFVYAGMNENDVGNFVNPYFGLESGFLKSVLLAGLDAIQIIMYFFSFVGLLFFSKRKSFYGPQLVLVTTFLTGLGCYFLWEAKGVYLLPFYIYLVPFAVKGLNAFAFSILNSHSKYKEPEQ